MKTSLAIALAMALANASTLALAADGLDLGSIKPKDSTSTSSTSSTATANPTPIGASPVKKAADAAGTPGTTVPPTTGIGTKTGPLNKSIFGTTPGKTDTPTESSSASDDVKVKIPKK